VSTIPRAQAIAEAAAIHSDLHKDLVDHYRTGGPRGVAIWAAGEDAPEHELQRITALTEAWAAKARARKNGQRQRGAA
jgi:hypothetical protein